MNLSCIHTWLPGGKTFRLSQAFEQVPPTVLGALGMRSVNSDEFRGSLTLLTMKGIYIPREYLAGSRTFRQSNPQIFLNSLIKITYA